VDSEIASLVKRYPIKSDVVISHIRQANSGRICLENTHPFIRELWDRQWTFAHNGQLKKIKQPSLNGFMPVGATDSDYAFCWILNQIREQIPVVPRGPQALWRLIKSLCDEISNHGVFNILMCDSIHLYAYCSTQLHWITCRTPFGKARLKDEELSVDFYEETTPNDVVSVIATEPLTTNETWNKIESGSLVIFKTV
jgi:predicted glutamine amidotransferase